MIDRRSVMASLGAVAAFRPDRVAAGTAPSDATNSPALDAVADEMLRRSPQLATALGLDRGELGYLSSQLDDRSRSGQAADAGAWAAQLARLPAAASLVGHEAIDMAAVRYALELAADGSRFTFGDSSLRAAMSEAATPYTISQLTGDWQAVPDFLDTQHRVETAADAGAYLARLHAFAAALDQETQSVRDDAARGVVLPRFAMEITLAQLRALRAAPAESTAWCVRSSNALTGSG